MHRSLEARLREEASFAVPQTVLACGSSIIQYTEKYNAEDAPAFDPMVVLS